MSAPAITHPVRPDFTYTFPIVRRLDRHDGVPDPWPAGNTYTATGVTNDGDPVPVTVHTTAALLEVKIARTDTAALPASASWVDVTIVEDTPTGERRHIGPVRAPVERTG